MRLKIQKSIKESDLIRACKKQNGKAQRMLYDRYAPLMLGLCRRYVSSPMEAEDVMINGFMKVFSKIESYEAKGSFEGWIKRIMINESLSFIRRNKSMYLEMDLDEVRLQPDYEMISTELETQDLLKMIGELPSGYRTIFNLYAIEGYSHREISVLLGISENTSKSQLSRARMHLQKKILEVENHFKNQRSEKDGK